MPRIQQLDLAGIDRAELQLEVLVILEREGVIVPEARAQTEFYFGACLELAGGAPRVLREAIANIRGRQGLTDGPSSAGQVFSMVACAGSR
jgi:hypothetical protein